jgi:hypothetical protein
LTDASAIWLAPRVSVTLRSLAIATMSVRGLCLAAALISSLRSGTSVLKRVGLSGVMTMKMIRSTSRMSMKGVTLMFGSARPVLEPPLIPITV